MPRPVSVAPAALVLVLLALVVGPLPASATEQAERPVGGSLLSTTGTVQGDGSPPLPAVTAASFVVADLDDGHVLAARAAHRRLPPASTLKLLTALVLLPRLEAGSWHRATRADADAEGSRVGLVAGQRYRVTELWHGLLLASGNDAAHALAQAAGGVPKTVRLMAAEARRLGALDTVVANPSGLDAPGQVSSAYDLALVTRAAVADPRFLRYAGAATFDFPGKPRWRTYQIQNQNRLLGRDGVFAGKTGFTTLARQTFVVAAERDGRRLVVTLLRPAENRRSWDEAAALLDWGFAAAAAGAEPVGRLVEPGELRQPHLLGGSAESAQPDGAPVGGGAGAVAAAPLRDSLPPAEDGLGPGGWALRVVAVLAAAVLVLRVRVRVRQYRRARLRAQRRAALAAGQRARHRPTRHMITVRGSGHIWPPAHTMISRVRVPVQLSERPTSRRQGAGAGSGPPKT